MKDRNPFVLNNDHVQRGPDCSTSQQPAAPVDARHTMTHSTQSPYVTHLYPAAAQPFNRGNANCTLEFDDYGTHVPPRTKKKRIVYGQRNSSTTSSSRQPNDNFVQLMGPKAIIDHLEELIEEAHGTIPVYTECDDIEQRNAHLSWAIDLTCSGLKNKGKRPTSTPIDSKPDSTSPCQTPRECQTRSYANLKKPSMKQTSKHPQQQNWICLSLDRG